MRSLIAATFLTLCGPTHAEPITNLCLPVSSCDGAWTNASAHAGWAVAIPLTGYTVDGRRGMYVAGLTWIGWTLLNEWQFHGPTPGPELRTDLLSRILPTLLVMGAIEVSR